MCRHWYWSSSSPSVHVELFSCEKNWQAPNLRAVSQSIPVCEGETHAREFRNTIHAYSTIEARIWLAVINVYLTVSFIIASHTHTCIVIDTVYTTGIVYTKIEITWSHSLISSADFEFTSKPAAHLHAKSSTKSLQVPLFSGLQSSVPVITTQIVPVYPVKHWQVK